MLRIYRVWCADEGDEDSARAVKAHNPEQAAEGFVRAYWEGIDCPDTLCVNVRAPRGDTTGWRVSAEQHVTFRAIREAQPSPIGKDIPPRGDGERKGEG